MRSTGPAVKGTMLLLATIFFCALATARALNNGLPRIPPVRWNSWSNFGGNMNEKLIGEMADAKVYKQHKGRGYQYIVIDDC